MELQFKICKQTITRQDQNQVVADSKNYLTASFTYSAEWVEVTKTALFTYRGTTYSALLVDDACTVPWEVIKPSGFRVSVFGGDLITANAVHIPVTASGLREGIPPEQPTPDIYTQFVGEFDKRVEAATEQAQRAEDEADRAEAGGNVSTEQAAIATEQAGIATDKARTATEQAAIATNKAEEAAASETAALRAQLAAEIAQQASELAAGDAAQSLAELLIQLANHDANPQAHSNMIIDGGSFE